MNTDKKPIKKKVVYEEKFVKGLFLNTQYQLQKTLKQEDIWISPISQGGNKDGTSFWVIRIDNIK